MMMAMMVVFSMLLLVDDDDDDDDVFFFFVLFFYFTFLSSQRSQETVRFIVAPFVLSVQHLHFYFYLLYLLCAARLSGHSQRNRCCKEDEPEAPPSPNQHNKTKRREQGPPRASELEIYSLSK